MDQSAIKDNGELRLPEGEEERYPRERRRHDVDSWGADELSIEQVRKVWAARAVRLAQSPDIEAVGASMLLLPLRLGRELVAVDVQYVMDIRTLGRLTRVPRVPAWVAGVTNLRGRIFSVIDLQQFLGTGPQADAVASRPEQALSFEDMQVLVVVETPAMDLVLLVDEVLPLQNVQLSRIQAFTSEVQVARPEYVRGIATADDGAAMVILDLPALLADEQLIVHEDAD